MIFRWQYNSYPQLVIVESNMNIERKEDLSCTENILYDVLHYIFQYLNIYDLNSAARVCK
jgi:hypothetical protein